MKKLALLMGIALGSLNSFSQETRQPKPIVKDTVLELNEVVLSANVIFGSKFVAKNRTGSSYYISPAEIQKFNYTDLNRMLRTVPGVTLFEEDGFGLRNNISLRGTSPERSAKITIMEDGILAAPAPYSAPAAYYFPTAGRMEAIEVLKGSSQVQYGPFTTGGAINLVSHSIPKKLAGFVNASYGSYNSAKLHALVGDSKSNVGYMVEYLNYNSDGFKKLDNGGNTGFDRNDFVAKFRLNAGSKTKLKQAFEAKFQYSDETSDETYVGITPEDFKISPFRRYAGSQKDEMKTEHLQTTLTHTLKFSDYFHITTSAYYNGFKRNWYKLNDVVFNGSKKGIAAVLENNSSLPDHLSILKGDSDSGLDALLIKANNREYTSKGIQTKFDYHWEGNNTFHDIEVGLRYHYDDEDRFQWVDGYNITNGNMQVTSRGIPGSDANRISSAKAFAAHAMYKLKYNNLTLTPGVRYENIILDRIDYGKTDPNRTGSNLSERENKVSVWIPGVGFNYNLNNTTSIFGGVHKGFSPPSNAPGQKAEESINYELGSRFKMAAISGEIIGFYNDYNNLLGSDSAASGGTGSLDQFNAGKVKVQGVELLINYNILQKSTDFILPITFGYTFTDTEFLTDFGSEEGLWGEVHKGDEIPYIAKHQFNLGISLEHKKFDISVNGRYSGAFRTQAGNGSIPENEKVASNFIVDMAAKYHLTKHVSLTGNIINLLDETYLVSRVPAGLRPGHPFGAYGGLSVKF